MRKRRTKKPLVSILIPNYNYESTIKDTIESALAQTYENIEIIVLDNHSTDHSFEIAKKYRRRGVRVYQMPFNIGVSSHNLLIKLARGKYIHVLHSDDMVLPEFIEKCVTLMEKNDRVGFTVTERLEINEKGELLETAPPFYNTSCIVPAESQKCVILMASYYIPSQTVYRRSVIERTGLYEVTITNFMDWWMLYKCSCISDMGVINEKLCRYRIWPGSETSYMVKHMYMPIQGYLNRVTMLRQAELDHDRRMLERADAAVEKQADLTLKLSTEVIRDGDYDMGRRYLELARAFSLNIVKSRLYEAIDAYLKNNTGQAIDEYLGSLGLCGRRNQSYDPPEDYILYKG